MAARHVLVPLGVVGIAAAILLWRSGEEQVVVLSDDVAECAANLREIHHAFLREWMRANSLPEASGPAVLGALLASGSLADRAALECPGPGAERPPSGRGGTEVTSADTGYAVRDLVAFPLVKFPSGGSELEAIAACDGARGLNHQGCMNVLYSDGSVLTLTLEHEIASGRLPPDAKAIPVGKDATNPDLAKLVP